MRGLHLAANGPKQTGRPFLPADDGLGLLTHQTMPVASSVLLLLLELMTFDTIPFLIIAHLPFLQQIWDFISVGQLFAKSKTQTSVM
jgi:hypothetical protein